MNKMNKAIERMRNGERITATDADFPLLCSEIEHTKQLVCELNTRYHSPDEIRALLERIWGQKLNAIVAAGAVVTKDVPENVIVAGVPAKIIRNIKQ